MNNEAVNIFMPENFEDEMEVIATIFTPTNDIGLAIAGENLHPTSKCPIVRIFMLETVDQGWAFKEELQAFAFSNFDEAQSFLENLPQMSALEMLIILNGQKDFWETKTDVGFLS
ncbi:hypothetical protein MHH33_12795 [Paenisporosarcina sp. FSL H8-0542]|uniref:hypothetical protein n=1 Tax=Paenisporosarcina sp. FSL H8-0542 TaxID=2921401 RepID=UPI003159F280